MEDKKATPTPEDDTSWLDDVLDSSNYGEDSLQQMKPLTETTAVRLNDDAIEKIIQEAKSDNWDLTETIMQLPPVPIFDEDYDSSFFLDLVEQEQQSDEPQTDNVPDAALQDEESDQEDALTEQEETNDSDVPVRKVRPRKKNTYGLLGIPHLLSTCIWLVIVVAIGLSLGRLLWICATDIMAFGREDRVVTITISPNDDIDDITDKLYNAGLIRYKQLFRFYADLSSAEKKISTGTFELNTLFDYKALVTGMSATSSYRETIKVTIPEGYTCAQIFALLEEKGVCSAEELKAYEVQSDYWFLEGSNTDSEYPLEGFLYPDTYNFYIGDSAKGVFRRFLARYDDIFNDELKALIVTLNDRFGTDFDLYDVMIIASMIEKESASSSENYDISSVIYNRLTHASEFPYLNIDATIVYAQGGNSEVIDKELNSPYNTYLYRGLPPTPICNPGLLSIQAALAPKETNYYYYALDYSLGLHHFSTTKAEHDAFVNSQKENE